MSKQINQEDLKTTTDMTIFGQTFQTYGDPTNPLFLANDIAKILEYAEGKVGQMLENVDDDEKLTDTIYRSGQNRDMWFLTENGLYELLMQSRKPLARGFKKEVKALLHKIRLGSIRENRTAINSGIVSIENAEILFPNFSGVEKQYNREGDRNFCVKIDPELSGKLLADGWNVKTLKPSDEGGEESHILRVKVNYKSKRLPMVYLYTKNNKTLLNEETIGSLDFADIANVDVVINPSKYEMNGNKGISAYLKSMHVTLNEDVFSNKYDAISGQNIVEPEYVKVIEDDELPF